MYHLLQLILARFEVSVLKAGELNLGTHTLCRAPPAAMQTQLATQCVTCVPWAFTAWKALRTPRHARQGIFVL